MVHDSQAYRKMDVTRERISRILELREILLSIQIGFSHYHYHPCTNPLYFIALPRDGMLLMQTLGLLLVVIHGP